jgi:hypothetical protein
VGQRGGGRASRSPGGLTFASINHGSVTTCGVTITGSAYCWGGNPWGSLGIGTDVGPESCFDYGTPPEPYPCSHVPIAVTGGLSFVALSSGFGSCGLTAAGTAYCWGPGYFGQLGSGGTTNSSAPVAVSGGLSLATISTSGGSSCGVTTGGVAYCWGDNSHGQLGDGTTSSNSVPVKVAGQP